MKQRAFLKSSNHLIDKMHSQWFADLILFLSDVEDAKRALFREDDRLRDDEKIDWVSESEAKKMKRNDNINEKKKSRIWLKKSASQRISIEFEISFNKIFDMIASFFNVIENNDEKNDWIANDDSTSENVKKNDDEAWSKEKSTKVVFWFFFFSIEDNIIEKKKTTKIVFRFFFFSSKIRILEEKKTTKIIFRFFFFFKRTTSDDDMMTAIFI
jgi:hypothetical protein